MNKKQWILLGLVILVLEGILVSISRNDVLIGHFIGVCLIVGVIFILEKLMTES